MIRNCHQKLSYVLLCRMLTAFVVISAMLCWSHPIISLAQTTTEKSESKPAETDTQADADATIFDFFDGNVPTNVDQLREMQLHFRELAEKVAKATVNVQVGNSQGSGVIISRDGYVMTAAHVIGGANRDATLKLWDGTPEGKDVKAKTLGLNRRMDSGLIKITEPGKYPYLEIGESASLKRGQWVMAIGHPGGWDDERGLVYRVGRVLQTSDRVIGTDCSLVGGDSGGPLVDMDGLVIGIHSRIGNRLRDNIHVPVDTYTETWDDLAQARDWGRGVGGVNPANEPWMGLSFKDDTLELETVVPEGPAAKAGLKPGDLLLKYDGSSITSQFRFGALYAATRPKQTVKIEIRRGDKEMELDVVVGSQADNPNR